MKHAILSDHNDYYRILSSDENIVEYAPTVQQLHMLMERYNIDVLWVMPGCTFSRAIRREHFEVLAGTHYSVYVPEHLIKNRVYGARVTYKLKGNYGEPAKDRYFMFPENREWKVPKDKDKGVWYVQEPQDLLSIVQLLEAEYGYCLWGPSYIGLHYFKGLLQRQGKVVTGLSEQQQIEYAKISREMVHPIAWANLHTHGKYLHWLDKNGWYLGGAQSVSLGNGAYTVNHTAGIITRAVCLHYKDVSYDGLMPHPLQAEGWAHIDLLEACGVLGVHYTVDATIQWEHSGKHLNQWAIDMWNKRASFVDRLEHGFPENSTIYGNLASTSKMIPNTMMGRLRNEGLSHWNDAIIHRAIANQLYTLMKLYREQGIAPVMVSKDALFFVSDEWDPYSALPSMLEHEHEQRGYKHVGTCELTPEIEHAFSRVNEKRFGVNGLEALIRRTMKHVTQ